MDIKQLNEELRKPACRQAWLEKQAGKESSDALLQILEFRMEDFKSYIDQRFSNIDQRFSILQWMMGIGFTVLALLITLLKFIG